MKLCDRCDGNGIVEVSSFRASAACSATCPDCGGSGAGDCAGRVVRDDAVIHSVKYVTAADKLQAAKQSIELAAVAINHALDAIS